MIVLLGQPGTGKSTQGKLIAKQKGWAWISTGDLIRNQLSKDQLVKINKGDLLGDNQTIAILNDALSSFTSKQEFMLDGFPRTIKQAKWLIDSVKSELYSLTAVIYLEITKEEATRRLLARGRKDDNIKTIEYRFERYTTDTLPVVNMLKKHGVRVYNINADQSPEQVRLDILKALANS